MNVTPWIGPAPVTGNFPGLIPVRIEDRDGVWFGTASDAAYTKVYRAALVTPSAERLAEMAAVSAADRAVFTASAARAAKVRALKASANPEIRELADYLEA